MNSVTLIGNLASDVELRELGEERKVASFLLAVDRPGKEDRADFVRVACWNRVADSCDRFLSKGRRVAVDGRLRSRSWEEEGKRRTAVEVVASSVAFLDAPAEREPSEATAGVHGHMI